MREILFRGKTKSGKWVEGYYSPANMPIVGCMGHFINVGGYNAVEIDPETVGQYTGLTDSNGTKIFEGDLLNGFEYPFLSDNAHNYFAEVIWFDNCPAFGLYTHKHPLSAVRGISEGNCELMEDFDSSQWEVIGNIHDNPELLEEGANDDL